MSYDVTNAVNICNFALKVTRSSDALNIQTSQYNIQASIKIFIDYDMHTDSCYSKITYMESFGRLDR